MLPMGCGIEWYIELKLEWKGRRAEAAAEAAIAEVAAAAVAEAAERAEDEGGVETAATGEAGGLAGSYE